MDNKIADGFKIHGGEVMVIRCDNQGVISLTKNRTHHVRTKQLMYNIILFECELKMEKFDLKIIQWNTWWQMSLPRHFPNNDITN
jgi:hypothetical protein